MEAQHFYEDNPGDPFYEDRQKAIARLRDLVDEACKILPTQMLGHTSYCLSAYLDASTGVRRRADDMSQDLATARQRRLFQIVRGNRAKGE
jgi:hypothetical protein